MGVRPFHLKEVVFLAVEHLADLSRRSTEAKHFSDCPQTDDGETIRIFHGFRIF